MYPWVIDFYDEEVWEIPEENADAVSQIFRDALGCVNKELGMGVKIEGDPEIVDNLSQIKCPDEYKEWLKREVAV